MALELDLERVERVNAESELRDIDQRIACLVSIRERAVTRVMNAWLRRFINEPRRGRKLLRKVTTAAATVALVLFATAASAQSHARLSYVAADGALVIIQATGGTFLVGQQPLTFEWTAPVGGGTVEFYEATVGALPRVNVGTALRWVMPTLGVGNHTAVVHACNHEQQTQAIQCGADATITFTLVNPTPVPGTPGAPNITPPNQVLGNQEIRILADSFSYVHRLRSLNGGEWNYLAAQYVGPIPVTYASEMAFLNEHLHAMLASLR